MIKRFGLTPRELDCVYQLLLGKTSVEIAHALALSPRTAESHLDHIKNKLGCFKKSELIGVLIKGGFSPQQNLL